MMTPDELSERLNGLVRDVRTEVAGIVREALAKPPAPMVELGMFDRWKMLYWPESGRVECRGTDRVGYWKPGELRPYRSPLMVNALLCAYREAVARGLATWPEGWEWLEEKIPTDWPLVETHVFMGTYRPVPDNLAVYTWSGSTHEQSIEGLRRAAMLGLCEAKPAPCRRWGQCTSLAKAESQPCVGCASYEPDEPAPEKSAEERLREAGAGHVRHGFDLGDSGEINAYVLDNGKVTIYFAQLTLPRAEAALRAATGDTVSMEALCDAAKYYADARQQLAAKGRAIAELEEKVRMCAADIAAAQSEAATLRAQLDMPQGDSRKEISDLKGAVASLRTSKDQWKSLARKHGERVGELEAGIADREKTIAGLRRIQDMLARNTPAPLDGQPGKD
jgi:hypothetical protein